MNSDRQSDGLRVEEVFRLLPDVESIVPICAVLMAQSRAPAQRERFHTFGKRQLHAGDVANFTKRALTATTTHCRDLYAAVADALTCDLRGDASGVVEGLLRAGAMECDAGRLRSALRWYEQAWKLARTLTDRRQEIAVLLRLGDAEYEYGRRGVGARHFQRALVLAESERNPIGMAQSCRGLGRIAADIEQWRGAQTWLNSALRYSADDRDLAHSVIIDQAGILRRSGDPAGAATRLAEAENGDPGNATARCLWFEEKGLVEAARGNFVEALTAWREGLVLAGQDAVPLDRAIALHLCTGRLLAAWHREGAAEDELRRAEDIAIAHFRIKRLARVYIALGELHGIRRDETGFVFFEAAKDLARWPEPVPGLEAEVLFAYAAYCREFGDAQAAQSCDIEAQRILAGIGERTTFDESGSAPV